jgi:hypothetical protein
VSTILWLPSSGTAAVSPTPSATDWTLHVNTVSRPLQFTRQNTALTTLAYNPDAADHLVAGTSMIAQFVSQILPPQTIAAQQVALGLRMLEVATGNNLTLRWKVYGCNVSGSSNLGDILAIDSGASELSTSISGITRAALTTARTFNEPWRLVVEIGVGGTPTTPGTHNASAAFGDPMATGTFQMPQDADTTACTPLLIFSNDIVTTFGVYPSYNLGV